MDIIAHGLWAGIGILIARRRWKVTPRNAWPTLLLAILPDVFHLFPILIWWAFGQGSFESVWAYAVPVAEQQPQLPPLVELLTFHLHCVLHSALVAAGTTILVCAINRKFWWPLLGWYLQIVIDVFTHSKAYFPSPVFYPISTYGFDGLAWPTPWFLWLNYAVIVLVGVLLFLKGNSKPVVLPR